MRRSAAASAAEQLVGLLFLSPLAVRLLAATAGRVRFTPRLALRDLGRHQARSGAVLAAITLAVGVPVVVFVLAAPDQDSATRGNLSAAQLLVRIGGKEPVLPSSVQAMSHAWTPRSDGTPTPSAATATPLVQVVTPDAVASRSSAPGRPLIEVGKKVASNRWTSLPLYVGTPEVARAFGFDLAAGALDAGLRTSLDGPLEILGTVERDLVARSHRIPGSTYKSVPKTFVQVPDNLTDAQVAAARDMAAAYGLTVETRDNQDDLATVRWAAVVGGVVLALVVLAMTVGTVRAEAADDLRTLTATGATRRIRRNLTAATAAGLAGAGVLLGTAGAYLVLTGAYFDDLGTLGRVPYGPPTLHFWASPSWLPRPAGSSPGANPRPRPADSSSNGSSDRHRTSSANGPLPTRRRWDRAHRGVAESLLRRGYRLAADWQNSAQPWLG